MKKKTPRTPIMVLEEKFVPYEDEGKDEKDFASMTPEEHYECQVNARGPVPRQYQLAAKDRHRSASSSYSWDNGEGEPLITITIPDWNCPSFCTFSMETFGSESDVRDYCRITDEEHVRYAKRHNSRYKTAEEIKEAKEKGFWREEDGDLEKRLDASFAGEQVTWADMGCSRLVPDAAPKVHARADALENEMELIHYNVWDWIYTFRAEQVRTEIIWLSYVPNKSIYKDKPFTFDDPESPTYKNAMRNAVLSSDPLPEEVFVRAIRVEMAHPNRCYTKGDAIFDVSMKPESSDVKRFSTRLFLIDKRFESKDALSQDIAAFSPEDLDYSCVFGAMLGDG